MDLMLRNKNVLVTASSSGIGNAIAEEFAREGANVILNGRDPEKLQTAADRLKRTFPDTSVGSFCGDILLPGVAGQLRVFLEKEIGALHVIVSNLGSGKSHSSDPLDVSEWRRVFDINLFSAVQLLDECSSLLERNAFSSILLISSIAGKERVFAPYSYSCAKGALIHLVKHLACHFAEEKIRVNCILPGNVFFRGGRWEELLDQNPGLMEEYIYREVPLKRLANPREIAQAAVFLTSPLSSFTTGAALVIDGGQTRSI